MVELETKSKPKIAHVFPGQGSQSVGMGYKLYQSSPKAKEVFQEADEALQFSLSRLCFEGPEDELRQTINAQPAIMTVSVACLRAASEVNHAVSPAFVAGHSLGEYTALVAANVLGFTDAIRLVRERGRLMQKAGEIKPGGMAAVIGLDEAALREICRESGAEIANFNCSVQIVISGSKEALARAMELAKARDARRVILLQVSGAFHSTLMQPTIEGLSAAISQINFRTPEIPIVVNSTAQPVTTAEGVKEELLRQLCNCVQWQPSVEYMVEEGVSTFIEIGPGQVLSGLIKRISDKVQVLNMSDPESIKALSL
ncbi:MAG: ACP S-malonyltransferase [Chloroflexi bacterium]|nr:ACP S-malonyltransferase [Chloroflexota bacterium]